MKTSNPSPTFSVTPPKNVQEVAARALEWRRKYNRGGTRVGAARARDLSHARPVSEETLHRMASYFARHSVDKRAVGFRSDEPGFPSAGRIAWDLWGGDEGQRWVDRILGLKRNPEGPEDESEDEPPWTSEEEAAEVVKLIQSYAQKITKIVAITIQNYEKICPQPELAVEIPSWAIAASENIHKLINLWWRMDLLADRIQWSHDKRDALREMAAYARELKEGDMRGGLTFAYTAGGRMDTLLDNLRFLSNNLFSSVSLSFYPDTRILNTIDSMIGEFTAAADASRRLGGWFPESVRTDLSAIDQVRMRHEDAPWPNFSRIPKTNNSPNGRGDRINNGTAWFYDLRDTLKTVPRDLELRQDLAESFIEIGALGILSVLQTDRPSNFKQQIDTAAHIVSIAKSMRLDPTLDEEQSWNEYNDIFQQNALNEARNPKTRPEFRYLWIAIHFYAEMLKDGEEQFSEDEHPFANYLAAIVTLSAMATLATDNAKGKRIYTESEKFLSYTLIDSHLMEIVTHDTFFRNLVSFVGMERYNKGDPTEQYWHDAANRLRETVLTASRHPDLEAYARRVEIAGREARGEGDDSSVPALYSASVQSALEFLASGKNVLLLDAGYSGHRHRAAKKVGKLLSNVVPGSEVVYVDDLYGLHKFLDNHSETSPAIVIMRSKDWPPPRNVKESLDKIGNFARPVTVVTKERDEEKESGPGKTLEQWKEIYEREKPVLGGAGEEFASMIEMGHGVRPMRERPGYEQELLRDFSVGRTVFNRRPVFFAPKEGDRVVEFPAWSMFSIQAVSADPPMIELEAADIDKSSRLASPIRYEGADGLDIFMSQFTLVNEQFMMIETHAEDPQQERPPAEGEVFTEQKLKDIFRENAVVVALRDFKWTHKEFDSRTGETKKYNKFYAKGDEFRVRSISTSGPAVYLNFTEEDGKKHHVDFLGEEAVFKTLPSIFFYPESRQRLVGEEVEKEQRYARLRESRGYPSKEDKGRYLGVIAKLKKAFDNDFAETSKTLFLKKATTGVDDETGEQIEIPAYTRGTIVRAPGDRSYVFVARMRSPNGDRELISTKKWAFDNDWTDPEVLEVAFDLDDTVELTVGQSDPFEIKSSNEPRLPSAFLDFLDRMNIKIVRNLEVSVPTRKGRAFYIAKRDIRIGDGEDAPVIPRGTKMTYIFGDQVGPYGSIWTFDVDGLIGDEFFVKNYRIDSKDPQTWQEMMNDLDPREETFLEMNPSRCGMRENPAWTNKIIADHFEELEDNVPAKWLPRVVDVKKMKKDIKAKVREYGCGVYGCVYPTLDKNVVMKLTSDETEAEFAVTMSSKLPAQVTVKYHLSSQLPETHEDRPVHLLWRDAADYVGDIEKWAKDHGEDADKMIDAINAQHDASQKALKKLWKKQSAIEELKGWVESLRAMAKVAPLRQLAEGMLENYRKNGVFFGDVHPGNIGWVKDRWLIVDPGNIVVLKSDPTRTTARL